MIDIALQLIEYSITAVGEIRRSVRNSSTNQGVLDELQHRLRRIKRTFRTYCTGRTVTSTLHRDTARTIESDFRKIERELHATAARARRRRARGMAIIFANGLAEELAGVNNRLSTVDSRLIVLAGFIEQRADVTAIRSEVKAVFEQLQPQADAGEQSAARIVHILQSFCAEMLRVQNGQNTVNGQHAVQSEHGDTTYYHSNTLPPPQTPLHVTPLNVIYEVPHGYVQQIAHGSPAPTRVTSPSPAHVQPTLGPYNVPVQSSMHSPLPSRIQSTPTTPQFQLSASVQDAHGKTSTTPHYSAPSTPQIHAYTMSDVTQEQGQNTPLIQKIGSPPFSLVTSDGTPAHTASVHSGTFASAQNEDQATEDMVRSVYDAGLSANQEAAVMDALLYAHSAWAVRPGRLRLEQELRPGQWFPSHIELGHGAFSTVYAGTMTLDDGYVVPVAVKALKGRPPRMRFVREMNAMWHNRHSAIIRTYGGIWLHDMGTDTQNTQYPAVGLSSPLIVLERMTLSLADFIGNATLADPMTQFVILDAVASALRFLHARGIVHRDVKPGNVLLRVDDNGKLKEAKLADFGAAYGTDVNNPASFAGTLEYMPPEVRANPGSVPNSAWDVWGFGLLIKAVTVQGPGPKTLDSIPDPMLRRIAKDCSSEDWRLRISMDKVWHMLRSIERKPKRARRNQTIPTTRRSSSVPRLRPTDHSNSSVFRSCGPESSVDSSGARLLSVLLDYRWLSQRMSGFYLAPSSWLSRQQCEDIFSTHALRSLKVLSTAAREAWGLYAANGREYYYQMASRLAKSASKDRTVAAYLSALFTITPHPIAVPIGQHWAPPGVGPELEIETPGPITAACTVGDFIVTGHADGAVRTWDANNGMEVAEVSAQYNRHSGSVVAIVALSTNSIASACTTGVIRLRGLHSGVTTKVIRASDIAALAASVDGQILYAGFTDGSLLSWYCNSGNPACPPIRAHAAKVTVATVSNDGRFLLTGSADGAVGVWATRNGMLQSEFWLNSGAHVVAGAFHGTANPLITVVCKDGYVMEHPKGVRRRVLFPGVQAADISPTTGSVAGGMASGIVRPGNGRHAGVVSAVLWTSDGRLVSCGEDGALKVYGTQASSKSYPPVHGQPGVAVRSLRVYGRFVASIADDAVLRIWDERSLAAVCAMPLPDGVRSHVQFVDHSVLRIGRRLAHIEHNGSSGRLLYFSDRDAREFEHRGRENRSQDHNQGSFVYCKGRGVYDRETNGRLATLPAAVDEDAWVFVEADLTLYAGLHDGGIYKLQIDR